VEGSRSKAVGLGVAEDGENDAAVSAHAGEDLEQIVERKQRDIETHGRSHRIQYEWASYPRTMVTLQRAPGAGVEDAAIDPVAMVENLKGRSPHP
jgi:hypothetical protein